MAWGKAASANEKRVFDKAGCKKGKLDSPSPPAQPPKCPECGSQQLYRDGLRYLVNGKTVQRWLCRLCGYRFSEPSQKFNVAFKQTETFNSALKLHNSRVASVNLPVEEASNNCSFMFTEDFGVHSLTKSAKGLNSFPYKLSNRQICDSEGESKNLTSATETETVAGETRKQQQDGKGLILEFAWKMKKRGLSEQTIKQQTYRLSVLVRKGADLMNPSSVETVLATEKWTPANKRFFVMAYQSFTKTMKIEWAPLKIKCQPKQPFIPLESEIDALISGCGKKTATLLQLLKDTGARIGEAAKLQWVDVDLTNSTVRINNPEKGSASRTIKLSDKTVAMIKALPKRNSYIFNTNPRNLQTVFARQRNKLAQKLQNPRLKQIHFHTLRHWKATTTYRRTRDILLVKYMLGHKRLENTEVYTHLVDFQNEEYHSATAKTVEEAKKLIESGFEYVTDVEGVKLFRKRK